MLRTQIKNALANVPNGKENSQVTVDISKIMADFTRQKKHFYVIIYLRINQKMNEQLEELKKERKLKIGTVELENKLKEKEAQITFLISQLQTLKEQKNQLEKSNATDQGLIGK